MRKHSALILLVSIGIFTFSGCGTTDNLVLSGSTEAVETEASSEVSGKVLKLEKSEGDDVKKGETLAIIDSSLQKLVVEQQEALLQLKKARLDEVKDSPASQLKAQAEADVRLAQAALDQAKLILGRHEVKAPSSGKLVSANVSEGSIIAMGSSVGTISDLKDLWVNVYIPYRYFDRVSLNQEVEITSLSLGEGKTARGKIIFIAAEAEFTPRNTETEEAKENTVYRLKIKLMDNIDRLKPGTPVDMNIPIGG